MSLFLTAIFPILTLADSIDDQLNSAKHNNTVLGSTIVTTFVPSSTRRGTLDIVWSCAVTIVACIYTSIHVHVPPRGASRWKRIKRKLRWSLTALLFPEVVVCDAFVQLRRVRTLVKFLDEHRMQLESRVRDGADEIVSTSQHGSIRTTFSLTYGFFVIMGGVNIDTSNLDSSFPSITLTEEGIQLLARSNHFIDISDKEIMDRSKTSPFAKALLCLQVSWMLAQYISRVNARLPITLLEVHTLAHVVCALCMYGLWWHKPIDIEIPIVVDGAEFCKETALMLMASKRSFPHWKRFIDYNPSELYFLHHDNTRLSFIKGYFYRYDDCWLPRTLISALTHAHGLLPGGFRVVEGYQLSPEFGEVDRLRWSLCGELLTTLKPSEQPIRVESKWDWTDTPFRGCDNGVVLDAHNDIFDSVFEQIMDMGMYQKPGHHSPSLLNFVSLLYGAFHLSTWNFDFPSTTEDVLWKIAAFTIVLSMPVYSVLLRVEAISAKRLDRLFYSLYYKAGRYTRICFVVVMGFLSFLSRIYLLIEALISLRKVPLGVFAVAPWLQSIPHI